MACEYGPMALGAFSVEIIFLPSDVYIQCLTIRDFYGGAIVLPIRGLCKLLWHVTLSSESGEESLLLMSEILRFAQNDIARIIHQLESVWAAGWLRGRPGSLPATPCRCRSASF